MKKVDVRAAAAAAFPSDFPGISALYDSAI
jgi:hypothetical protein